MEIRTNGIYGRFGFCVAKWNFASTCAPKRNLGRSLGTRLGAGFWGLGSFGTHGTNGTNGGIFASSREHYLT